MKLTPPTKQWLTYVTLSSHNNKNTLFNKNNRLDRNQLWSQNVNRLDINLIDYKNILIN